MNFNSCYPPATDPNFVPRGPFAGKKVSLRPTQRTKKYFHSERFFERPLKFRGQISGFPYQSLHLEFLMIMSFITLAHKLSLNSKVSEYSRVMCVKEHTFFDRINSLRKRNNGPKKLGFVADDQVEIFSMSCPDPYPPFQKGFSRVESEDFGSNVNDMCKGPWN